MATRIGRGFEVAKGFEDQDINLPIQMTTNAAGYDFEAAADAEIKPIWGSMIRTILHLSTAPHQPMKDDDAQDDQKKFLKPTLVPTGIKAFMEDDEKLDLYNRSSNPLKKFLLLSNGLGLIDSDYYSNPDNDGHIMFQFINFGLFPVTIKKGERIGQGVFSKFLRANNGACRVEGATRQGGHGSTN